MSLREDFKDIKTESASVGGMMPVTPVDQVLSKKPLTEEVVNQEFDALRLTPNCEPEEDDCLECLDSSPYLCKDGECEPTDIEKRIEQLNRETMMPPVLPPVNPEEERCIVESGEEEVFLEAAKIDDDIKDIVDTLNEKGYTVKYSCSGHPSSRAKNDNKRDGVRYGKLYTTARIVFDKIYDFPNIPTGWEKKILDEDKTAIYVKEPEFKIINGLPLTQYYNWKKKYMYHLEKWAKELPKENETKDDENSELTLESVMTDLFIDSL